jgi:hypothetical protein
MTVAMLSKVLRYLRLHAVLSSIMALHLFAMPSNPDIHGNRFSFVYRPKIERFQSKSGQSGWAAIVPASAENTLCLRDDIGES